MLSMHSDLLDMRQWLLNWAAIVPLACVLAAGCARYHARPLTAAKVAGDFEARTLSDAALQSFLETNGVSGEWPKTPPNST